MGPRGGQRGATHPKSIEKARALYTVGIPEATEALARMARFFDEQLGR